jgi:2-methylcitrate dehydratase PrpD
VLDLAAEHDLDPKAIDEIHVRIGDAQDLMLRQPRAEDALEAKFSIEFAVASALVARKGGPEGARRRLRAPRRHHATRCAR